MLFYSLKNTGKKLLTQGKHREFHLNPSVATLFEKLKHRNKYWKNGKNTGKVREICQSGNVGTLYLIRICTTCVFIIHMLYISGSDTSFLASALMHRSLAVRFDSLWWLWTTLTSAAVCIFLYQILIIVCRLQTGMRGAFGKPQGTVARVRIGQPLISVRARDQHKAEVIEALRRAKFKFPGRQKVGTLGFLYSCKWKDWVSIK